MNEKTERAIRQVPHEIRRQTKVMAAIGEALIDTKIKTIKSQSKFAKHHLKKAWDRALQSQKLPGKSVVPKEKQAKR